MGDMPFEWDPAKDRSNKTKHGLSFRDASELFSSDADCLEIYDEAHSVDEDRFIAVGPVRQGVIVVVFTERQEDVIRILSARMATPKERDRYEAYLRGRHGR
jgi:uncharacterized DUF497 family protein